MAVRKVRIRPHLRKVNGKKYKIKGYSRASRPKGKKVMRYQPVGIMELGFDKYGNIKKSRVVKLKKRMARKARQRKESTLSKLDEKYIKGQIDERTWAREQLKRVI